jgi:hypothetical protein
LIFDFPITKKNNPDTARLLFACLSNMCCVAGQQFTSLQLNMIKHEVYRDVFTIYLAAVAMKTFQI